MMLDGRGVCLILLSVKGFIHKTSLENPALERPSVQCGQNNYINKQNNNFANERNIY